MPDYATPPLKDLAHASPWTVSSRFTVSSTWPTGIAINPRRNHKSEGLRVRCFNAPERATHHSSFVEPRSIQYIWRRAASQPPPRHRVRVSSRIEAFKRILAAPSSSSSAPDSDPDSPALNTRRQGHRSPLASIWKILYASDFHTPHGCLFETRGNRRQASVTRTLARWLTVLRSELPGPNLLFVAARRMEKTGES